MLILIKINEEIEALREEITGSERRIISKLEIESACK